MNDTERITELERRIAQVEMMHKPIGAPHQSHCEKCGKTTTHQGGICRECPTREGMDAIVAELKRRGIAT